MMIEKVSVDIGIPMYGSAAANVCAGARPVSRFIGPLSPIEYSDIPAHVEARFDKGNSEMEDITVFLPRNETITEFEVEVPNENNVESPTPYRNKTTCCFLWLFYSRGWLSDTCWLQLCICLIKSLKYRCT